MIEGKIWLGRPGEKYIGRILKIIGKTNVNKQLHITRDRTEWRRVVDNVLEDTSLQ